MGPDGALGALFGSSRSSTASVDVRTVNGVGSMIASPIRHGCAIRLKKLAQARSGAASVNRMSDERAASIERIEALTIAISIRSMPMVLESLLSTSLSIQQLKVLSVIVSATEPPNARGLADRFGVTMATTSNLLDRLEEQTLIERVADGSDSRVRRLHPTPLGRAVVAKVMAARPELGIDVLNRLDESDLAALEQGLRAVGEALRSLRGAKTGATGSA